jgi:hypothetical protein
MGKPRIAPGSLTPVKRENWLQLLQIKVQEAAVLVKSWFSSKYFILPLDNSRCVI